jgi:hypothetical protein
MSTTVIRSEGGLVATNFTRPNDTNAYASGDVVCDSTSAPTILTFSSLAKNRFSTLMSATIVSSANQATKLEGQLWLFDTTVVAVNDNAAFAPTDAEMRTVLHVIEFPASAWIAGTATAGAGGNAMCNAQSLWLPINTTKDSNGVYHNDVFAVLVARNAYTPVAQERFDIRLGFMA